MNKKNVFVAIAIFAVGIVCGTILNFIVREGNSSVGLSIMQGFFVGILPATLYLALVLFLGFAFDEKYLDKFGKFMIIMLNVAAVDLLWFGITMFITNDKGIPPYYAWMHIVIIVFAILVVLKSNYDGKIIRKSRKE